ncbi:hypothetical protein PoB_007208000 [Plakobranchus ocellatus]|uniref:Uncharacterized protein n=1 Tax=Plakobranchus ocellatus TaxID=259542 RepID=A0AAV4DNS7_9GAST|nr:hypothetical protein PoB_007208000 [Plakobranchus ocellatus]
MTRPFCTSIECELSNVVSKTTQRGGKCETEPSFDNGVRHGYEEIVKLPCEPTTRALISVTRLSGLIISLGRPLGNNGNGGSIDNNGDYSDDGRTDPNTGRLKRNPANLISFSFILDRVEADNASPPKGDLRLSGPPSGQGAGGGARTRDRRVPAEFRADSLVTVPSTPPYCRRIVAEWQKTECCWKCI